MRKITICLLALLAVAFGESVYSGSEAMPTAPDYGTSECWYTNVAVRSAASNK